MPSSNILRVLVLAFVTPSHVFASPSVNVGMTAAFKAGPYLLELLYVDAYLYRNGVAIVRVCAY